jgi:TatD DNase family protein
MTGAGEWLVDTHCHLNLPEFENDLEEVLRRAEEAGVARIVVPGIDLESSTRAVRLAERFSQVYAAVGVHPHAASTWEASTEAALTDLMNSERVVAVGEIGLDFYRSLSPSEVQREAFRAQLAIAAAKGLPVVIHNREATEEIVLLVQEWTLGLPPTLSGRAGVMHAFSADLETASKAVEAGFYIGIAGPITYPGARELRDLSRQVPSSRLLVETDSPYLPPQPFRGERNEPSRVRFVAERLAEVCGETLEETARTTAANAARLFGWDDGTDNSYLL